MLGFKHFDSAARCCHAQDEVNKFLRLHRPESAASRREPSQRLAQLLDRRAADERKVDNSADRAGEDWPRRALTKLSARCLKKRA